MPLASRDEVWLVDLGLAAKVRPALVVSAAFAENARALFSVMPHTTAVWGTRFEAAIPVKWLDEGAFDAQGIRPVPSKVFLRKLGTLNAEQLAKAETAIAAWFSLNR